MTKLQLLHRALNERMMTAVEQIMEMVGGTVLEYEEETARVRKENEVLKRRLQWMEEENRANWPGPSELASNPSQPKESAVSFEFEQESQAVVIKTEFNDHPLYVRPLNSLSMLPQSTDQESAGTSTSVNSGQTENITWPSTESYMEPLEFDPTSSTSFRCAAGRGKRQRMSFACPDCGKVFGREQGLLFHMRTHSKEKPYAYRSRKTCFYGDGIRKRKLHGLSQISGENTDDLLDGSENAHWSSPSDEHPAEEQEADSLSAESDQNNANGPENIAPNPVRLHCKRKKKMSRCPLCGLRFVTRDQLEFHMKSHMVDPKQSLHNPSSKSQQERKKKRRKIGMVKKTKDTSRRLFPCPECDRVFSHVGWLDSHMKSHEYKKASLHEQPNQTELSEDKTEMAIPEDNGSTEVPAKTKVKKTLNCPHCPRVFFSNGWLRSHIQTAHCKKKISEHFNIFTGIGRTRSQRTLNQQLGNTECTVKSFGTHPCQLCDKVYSSVIWLRKHMHFHLAASGQQSETDDMKGDKINASKRHSSGNASKESEGGETMDASKAIKTSTATCDKSHYDNQSGSVSMSQVSLQPRVVLQPIMPKPMYWSMVPSTEALKSGNSESRGFDLVQNSSSVVLHNEMDNSMEEQTMDHCTKPVESFGNSNQNKVQAIYRVIPETDIVCVTVGLPQIDSQSELLNHEHCTIIGDEPDESVTHTSTVESSKLTGTKHDCKDISADSQTCGVTMKICNPTLLVFSDDMDDVTSPSKSFDEKKTEDRSSHGLLNDSQGAIIIDDEQSMTQTSTVAIAAENDRKEPGVTKQIMLTINEQTAISESVMEDDRNDAPNYSKGYGENSPA